jgi:hypothetical protein
METVREPESHCCEKDIQQDRDDCNNRHHFDKAAFQTTAPKKGVDLCKFMG